MFKTRIRFEGIDSDHVHEKPFKVGTKIALSEVQNQRWELLVSHGSVGGTFRRMVHQSFDADKAKQVFLTAIKDAFGRSETPTWIEQPGLERYSSVLIEGDAAKAAVTDLQMDWTAET